MTYVVPPLDLVDGGMSVDDAVEVDVRAFPDGFGVEGSAQNYLRLGGICNTSSNYPRIMSGNCHLANSYPLPPVPNATAQLYLILEYVFGKMDLPPSLIFQKAN
jgi:hypothetical protein